MFVIGLDGSSLTLDELIAIACRNETVTLTDAARARVRAARDVVDEFAHRDQPTYGINTGFGNFADVRIPPDSLDELQVNLLRSHAPSFWMRCSNCEPSKAFPACGTCFEICSLRSRQARIISC